jgi:hypothetical protein
MGLKERGGLIVTAIIPDVKKPALRGVVNEVVEKGSVVSTDELYSYNLLTGDGYAHGTVQHGKKEYAYYGREPPRSTTWRAFGSCLRFRSAPLTFT